MAFIIVGSVATAAMAISTILFYWWSYKQRRPNLVFVDGELEVNSKDFGCLLKLAFANPGDVPIIIHNIEAMLIAKIDDEEPHRVISFKEKERYWGRKEQGEEWKVASRDLKEVIIPINPGEIGKGIVLLAFERLEVNITYISGGIFKTLHLKTYLFEIDGDQMPSKRVWGVTKDN